MKLDPIFHQLKTAIDLPSVSLDVTPDFVRSCIFRKTPKGSYNIIKSWDDSVTDNRNETIINSIRKHNLQGYQTNLILSGPDVRAEIVHVPSEAYDAAVWIEQRIDQSIPFGMDRGEALWSLTGLSCNSEPAHSTPYLVSLFRKRTIQEIADVLISEKCSLRSIQAGISSIFRLLRPDIEPESTFAALATENRLTRILLIENGSPSLYRELPVGTDHIKEDATYYHNEIEKLTHIHQEIRCNKPRIKSFILISPDMDIYNAHLEKNGYKAVTPSQYGQMLPCVAAGLIEANIPVSVTGLHQANIVTFEKSRTGFFRWLKPIALSLTIALGIFLFAEAVLFTANHIIIKDYSASQNAYESYKNSRQKLARLRRKYRPFFDALAQKPDVSRLMHDLGRTVPENLWLGKLKLSSSKEGLTSAQITGYAKDSKQITQFIASLENSSRFTSINQRFTEIMNKKRVAKLSRISSNRLELTKFKLEANHE